MTHLVAVRGVKIRVPELATRIVVFSICILCFLTGCNATRNSPASSGVFAFEPFTRGDVTYTIWLWAEENQAGTIQKGPMVIVPQNAGCNSFMKINPGNRFIFSTAEMPNHSYSLINGVFLYEKCVGDSLTPLFKEWPAEILVSEQARNRFWREKILPQITASK